MKDKLKASFTHLLISALVITFFYLFITTIWYPGAYFHVSGLLGVLSILVLIDVVLGPLLTFVVYKKNKPSLRFDLATIAALQIAALSYGIYTVHNGHPVYVAYAVDRFTLVSPNEVDTTKIKYDTLKTSPFSKPKIVYAKLPDDPEEKNALLFSSIKEGKDLEHHAEFYEPIDNFTDEILARSVSIDHLNSHPDSKTKLSNFLEKQSKPLDTFAFLPLMGKKKVMLWALDKSTGKPVAALDIDPWELDANNS